MNPCRPPRRLDHVGSGPQHQVVRVAQHDLGAERARRSAGRERPHASPRVPTGMNSGVGTSPAPCGPRRARAAPSVASTSMVQLHDWPRPRRGTWRRRRRGSGSRRPARSAYRSRQRGPTKASIMTSSDDRGRWKFVMHHVDHGEREPRRDEQVGGARQLAASPPPTRGPAPRGADRDHRARRPRRPPTSSRRRPGRARGGCRGPRPGRRDRPERVEPDDQLDAVRPSAPAATMPSSTAGVRCRPAVGAAADAGRSANTVW